MPNDTKTPAPALVGTSLDATVPATSGRLPVPAVQPPPSPANPPPPKRSWWVWAGLAMVAIAAGGLWYFQPWVSKGLAVTVETIAPAALTRVLAVNGRLAPQHLFDVKPKIGGEVIAVLVEEGAVVTQGDILARIDASGQQAMVRQAMAGLDAGLVAQAQAEADLARAEALGGNITRTALADARSAEQTAMQEVARLTAVFDQMQIDLEKFTILAPSAGTILARNAEVGQVADVTSALFSMADRGQLVVETDVDETYAARVKTGQPAILQLKGETDKRDGTVSFVAPQVDATTGGLAIKIAFEQPVTAPVGLTVTANIIVDQQDAAIAVPRAAVVTDATGSAVFVAVADHAVRRAVIIVDWPADRLEVSTGLVEGDVVITDATGLSDGIAIALSTPGAGP